LDFHRKDAKNAEETEVSLGVENNAIGKVQKVISRSLLKNDQMQGPRNPEE
jgi:hypothetical protein